jgi:hypothetical protein
VTICQSNNAPAEHPETTSRFSPAFFLNVGR